MTDDFLRMLDLDGREPTPAGAPLAVTPADDTKSEEPASRTALRLDAWGLRRGRDVLRESQRLRECLAGLGGEDLQAHAVADFHGVAFEADPRLHDACTDPLRLEFVRQLLQTPECRGLRAATVLNDTASEIAAAAFAAKYAELRKDQETTVCKDRERAGPEGAGPGRGASAGDFAGEVAVLRRVGAALAEAAAEVEAAREAAAALGLGPGAPGANDPKAIAALYKRFRSDPALRRICELAGRYRRLAQSRQRRKATHGLDDVVGVTLDGELGRVLPHELAKLAVPELELDALRRLAERQLLCRDYRATEPVGKGPVIVCVDESGSMEGEKAHTAKALALALAWVARKQRRWCALVAYSGDSGERLLALPPGRWDEAALIDWLVQFIGHGSDLDVPVRELPRYYEQLKAPKGDTDVIFVTDAVCRIPAGVRDDFLAWKRVTRARLISLVVGGEPGDLAGVSDESYRVESLAATEEAVGRTLDI